MQCLVVSKNDYKIRITTEMSYLFFIHKIKQNHPEKLDPTKQVNCHVQNQLIKKIKETICIVF